MVYNYKAFFGNRPATPATPSPFYQLDWPLVARARLTLKSDAPSSEPPAAAAVVQAPFNQDLWESPTRLQQSLKSDTYYGSFPLYSPNPATPFGQDLWENAAPGKARATGEVAGTYNSLLTPNPVAPFNQYEWRAPARVSLSLKSDSYWGSFPLYSPNPSAPFGQDLWENATKAAPKAVGEAVGGDAPLLTPNPAQPFSVIDWSRSLVVKTAKVDDVTNLLPVQTVVVVLAPFSQAEWPGVAKKPNAVASQVYAGPASLVTPNPSAPFSQEIWDSATRGWPKAGGEATAGILGLLSPNPARPFIQVDWPGLPGVKKAKADDPANLLPVQTVVVVFAPFSQNEWSGAAKRPNTVVSEVYASATALLFPNPSRPFSQGIWDRATKAYPKAVDEPPGSNVSIFFQSLAVQPFSQSDWPNPVGGFALKNGTWINVGLTDGGVIPPEPPEPPVEPPRNDPAGIQSAAWKPRKKVNYRSYRFLSDKEIEQLTGAEIREAARELRADVRKDPLAEEVEKEVAALARMAAVLSDIDRLEASVAELTRAIDFAAEQKLKAEAEQERQDAEDEEIAIHLLS